MSLTSHRCVGSEGASGPIARGLRDDESRLLWEGMFSRFPEYYKAMESLCDVLLRFAMRRRLDSLEGVMPTDHPLVGLLRAYKGLEHTRPKVLLIRLVNLNRLLARIRPALQRRLSCLECEGKVDPDDLLHDLDVTITVAGPMRPPTDPQMGRHVLCGAGGRYGE